MSVENMVTYTEFQSNPELIAKFNGSYESYLSSFAAKLSGTALFNFASQNGGTSIPGLDNVSVFMGNRRVSGTKNQPLSQTPNDIRQIELQQKLEKISDPKIRAQIEAELAERNLSDAFFELLMDRYDKKKEEFDEIWEKYQIAKGEAADMKKTCERLLKEYQSNEGSVSKGQYQVAENKYNDANMWADIYLSHARDVSHRAV